LGGGDEHVSLTLRPYREDRGHVVVTSGPYSYLRHPMYVGIIVLCQYIPLALGSWRALLPGTAIAILLVIRAWREDRMLRNELARYEEYVQRMRYRLVRGVW